LIGECSEVTDQNTGTARAHSEAKELKVLAGRSEHNGVELSQSRSCLELPPALDDASDAREMTRQADGHDPARYPRELATATMIQMIKEITFIPNPIAIAMMAHLLAFFDASIAPAVSPEASRLLTFVALMIETMARGQQQKTDRMARTR
jgi:hypothetical protein